MVKGMVSLRKLKKEDLIIYRHWKLPGHAYHNFNGPYFKQRTQAEIEEEIAILKEKFDTGISEVLPKKRMIVNAEDQIVGEVSWYWKSEETNWLEIGIVIFDENFWNQGIGLVALRLWITELFNTKTELVRLGLTTWSGNKGMIRLAEKLGMCKEATYRKARIVNGAYFDSISYGLLREEWFD